jgi:hypothetical protein
MVTGTMFSCAANSISWPRSAGEQSLFEHVGSQKFEAKRPASPDGHRQPEKRAHYSTPRITKQPIPSRDGIAANL